MAAWRRSDALSLRDKLDAIRAAFEADIDPPTGAAMEAAARDLALSGIGRRALSAGAMAPLFDLVDANGGRVRLAALLRRGPVVVSFHRGDWCPYCLAELGGLSEIARVTVALGASLVAISPQAVEALRPDAGVAKLGFPVLSDPGARTASAYGIAFELPEGLHSIYDCFGHGLPGENGSGWYLPVPATYMIEQTGRIALSYVDIDYRSRLEPDAVVAALRALHTRDDHAPISSGNSRYEAAAPTSRGVEGGNSSASEHDQEDSR